VSIYFVVLFCDELLLIVLLFCSFVRCVSFPIPSFRFVSLFIHLLSPWHFAYDFPFDVFAVEFVVVFFWEFVLVFLFSSRFAFYFLVSYSLFI